MNRTCTYTSCHSGRLWTRKESVAGCLQDWTALRVARDTLCVHSHTRARAHAAALSRPYTGSLSSRLFAQILTLVTGGRPNPTLASSVLSERGHVHARAGTHSFSDSLTRNDRAHLPNRPCNLFENLCLRDEEGSAPDFITFP